MQRITAFEAGIEMQPWFGPQEGAGVPSTDELCAAFWGGCGFPVSEFLLLKRRWALAKPGWGMGGAPLPPAAPCRSHAGNQGAAEAKQGRGGGESLTIWVAEGGEEGGGEGACGSVGVWCGRPTTRGLAPTGDGGPLSRADCGGRL